MNQITYKIDTFWDREAQVWVATSEDISGLATEANNWEALREKLRIIMPELLRLNQQISEQYQGEIYLEIVSHCQELIKVA